MFLDFLEVRIYWENFHVVSARVRPSGSASERTCCLIRLTYAFRKYLATVRALDMEARRVAINSIVGQHNCKWNTFLFSPGYVRKIVFLSYYRIVFYPFFRIVFYPFFSDRILSFFSDSFLSFFWITIMDGNTQYFANFPNPLRQTLPGTWVWVLHKKHWNPQMSTTLLFLATIEMEITQPFNKISIIKKWML